MNRNEKKNWVASMKDAFLKSQSVVVAAFKGLTVSEISDLRANARKLEASVKVTQNRLTKLALKGTDFEGLAPLFKGSTLVAYSPDFMTSAKVVSDFAKTNDKLEILGGVSEGEVLSVEGVKELAMMPTLNEARAKLCFVLSAAMGNMARAVKARAEQLEQAA